VNDKAKVLTDVLIELKNAPREDPKATMKKYNMLFYGGKFNMITSIELAHYLKEQIDDSFTHEDVLNLLPSITQMLNMKIEKMIQMEDVGKPEQQQRHSYFITLF
jgi:hypothetical protein